MYPFEFSVVAENEKLNHRACFAQEMASSKTEL